MAAILKTSPLKTLFDSSQLSGSINVQDGGTTSFLKTIHGSRPKIHLLCRLDNSNRQGKSKKVPVIGSSKQKTGSKEISKLMRIKQLGN